MTEIRFEKLEAHRIPTNIAGKFIEVELYYSKGGYNVFTYKNESRGYYVRICPITVERNMVSFIAFSGTKVCIHECSRKSAKAEREAIAAVNNEYRDLVSHLVSKIANQNNLEV